MLRDWAQLIHEAAAEPMHARELVAGEPDFVGTLDASGEGAGGVWLPGRKHLAPTVWQVQWPNHVKERLVLFDNPNDDLTNCDLEMAAELLGGLVLKGLVATCWTYMGVCSNNSVTVVWQRRGASKWSRMAN